MRSIWNGVLHFGRVAVPVALVPSRKKGDAAFTTLHRPCGQPVGQTTVCPLHGEVPDEELVRGWEVVAGQYVLVEDDELDATVPDAGRDLEVIAYVTASAIENVYLTSTYYLRPANELAGKRAYALVADALNFKGAALITRYVTRKREHFGAVVALDKQLLALQTLALAEDVTAPAPIHESLNGIEVDDQEAELARQLVARYESTFEPSMLVGLQRARVRELLEGKIANDELVVPAVTAADVPKTGPAGLDLAAALRASLKEAPKAKRKPRPRVVASA